MATLRSGIVRGLIAFLFGTLLLAGSASAGGGPPPWRHTIDFPLDSFFNPAFYSGPGWVKFTILLSDPSKVYFQNSNTYQFHYEFAVEHLPPFAGMTGEQFDAATLHIDGQLAVLGAVLRPPLTNFQDVTADEYGIQFVGQDAYPPQQVVDWFHTVRSAVNSAPSTQAFYMPTFEQVQVAQDNLEFFLANGAPVSSPGRWVHDNVCYAQGWALGRLTFVAASEIEDAYLAGDLRPEDILLTDGVPAELPYVSGIVSLVPGTPNSHVAILAVTYGVPFVHLASALDAERAQALVGRTIVLRAAPALPDLPDLLPCLPRIIDVHDELDAKTIEALLRLKAVSPLDFAAAEPYGSLSAAVADLTPNDIRYFGGKAANYSLLLDSIPGNTRVAAAFSFDLWNAFLDQELEPDVTLRDHIAATLAGHAWPPDFQALATDLSGLRDLIKDQQQTAFSPAIQQQVIDTLLEPRFGFDPMSRLRFRSSTNVEDSEQFTGAGLYESKSGCLADELDEDDIGPSLCEPDEPDERGVFRAIRRVFASFFNDNAFLQRLLYGVDDSQVGMALLVHHSFPDETELANGVATFTAASNGRSVLMVTQDGAVSVTNPDEPGAIPEEVWGPFIGGNFYPEVFQHSNLVQLGATVMDWQDDYLQLAGLLDAAAGAFEDFTGKTQYVLDFEYKKVTPDGQLVVKQLREIPQLDDEPSQIPFLVNEPTEYEVLFGETSNVFANHRLKTRMRLQTPSFWLTPDNVEGQLYSDAEIDFNDGCQVATLTGPLADLPGATHQLVDADVLDTWTLSELPNPRTLTLQTPGVPWLVSPAQSPIVVQSDIGLGLDGFLHTGHRLLTAAYAKPVKYIDWTGEFALTTSEIVVLWPKRPPRPDDLPQDRHFVTEEGLEIEACFYFPTVRNGPVAGYTAPLVRWEQTVISGLTSDPIVLTGDFAQTYRPGHHNFTEEFIFEPRLDPSVSTGQLQELDEQGIRGIYLHGGSDGNITQLILLGDDDLGGACPAPACPADIDGDGMVGVLDLVEVIVGWGPCPQPPTTCPADINQDGNVSVLDLVEVIVSWGGCGP